MTRRAVLALLGGLAGVLGGLTAPLAAGIPVGTRVGRFRVTGWHRYVTPGLPGLGFRVEAVDVVTGERVANAARIKPSVPDPEGLARTLLFTWLEAQDWRRHPAHAGLQVWADHEGDCDWRHAPIPWRT